jgi:hypothetical protein
MCYSSCEGWQYYKKDHAREAEGRRETSPDVAPEPQVQAEESKMWADLAKLEQSAVEQPDRVSEGV